MRPLALGEPYRISCAVCGKACEWIAGEEDAGPQFGGWYCKSCDAYTEEHPEEI